MKSAIDKVLSAEDEARRLVDDAREKYQESIKTARADGETYKHTAMERAMTEADALLQNAVADAELESQRIRVEAKARAEEIVRVAGELELTFLSSAIEQISGTSL